ncbi:ATP-binding cassette domain-containing protein [Thiospirochaeta perfilievii]|uniref:ATP-binding cassette domain-containing protein n=1 Tax=Thiospirochaeta perfilievii TaxID=252967 RepID=A0A5C1QCL4_9SPIO|nr:ATP-binding cassette domain-containing protein [Thiospirochaeta perfilievii]QEN05197.1 ATP-binding cassette domain-containing protein [Thiospirochaeta perfilievii]
MKEKKPILQMENITKDFPGVKALDSVHLNVFKGEVMALLGENGAGKSTLMKILSGVYENEKGSILLKDKSIQITSPKNAMDLGIGIIHQELNLIPGLTVGENIFLGKEPTNKSKNINWNKLYTDSDNLLKRLGSSINSKAPASTLSIGDQQMVEIAKALSVDAEILIFDEPTDALTDREANNLFRVIEELKENGKGIVYISHRLPEVFEICDRVTVLRDGQFIGERAVSELDEDGIIEMMVGRKLTDQIPFSPHRAGEILLEVKDFNSSVSNNINFNIKQGEIVGIGGLMGAGRTEMALSLYGMYPCNSGEIILNGQSIKIDSPQKAIEKGIAYVSEDRKQLGLFLGLSIKDNITLPALKEFEKLLYKIDEKERNSSVDEYINQISIKTPNRDQLVGNLSGGNQQKIAIARGLITKPKLLILDEPTRGVDVGAKKEIYTLINKFKDEGLAILMISSEMPELLGLSDRILVMHNNTITGELSRDEASQESIMRMAVGLKEKVSE